MKSSRALFLSVLALGFFSFFNIAYAVPQSLTLGSTGEEVKILQQNLKDAGCDPGPIDGKYGKRTAVAVKECQENSLLSTTSSASPLTITTSSPLEPITIAGDTTVGSRRIQASGLSVQVGYNWSLIGSLPPGMGLGVFGCSNHNDWNNLNYIVLEICKRDALVAGTYQFTIKVTNGVHSATKDFVLTVNPAFTHPADTNGDLRISISELTAYGLKVGQNGQYFNSANIIWRNGEKYVWNPGRQDWMPTDGMVIVTESPLPDATVGQNYSTNIYFSFSYAFGYSMFLLPPGLSFSICDADFYCTRIHGTPTVAKAEPYHPYLRLSLGGSKEFIKYFDLTVLPAPAPISSKATTPTTTNTFTPEQAPTPTPTTTTPAPAPTSAPVPAYVPPAPTTPTPAISSLSISTGPVGTQFNVYGFNLTSTTVIHFNDSLTASCSVGQYSSLVCTVPSGTTIGTYPVYAATASGTRSPGWRDFTVTGSVQGASDFSFWNFLISLFK